MLEEAAQGDGAAQKHVWSGGSGPEEECGVLIFAYIRTSCSAARNGPGKGCWEPGDVANQPRQGSGMGEEGIAWETGSRAWCAKRLSSVVLALLGRWMKVEQMQETPVS